MYGLLLALCCAQPVSNDESPIRVGIVAYEDFQHEREGFEEFFRGLSRLDTSLQFELALGSYGEVLNWLDRQMIDVAILTPGAFARSLSTRDAALPATCEYLATLQLPPATCSWAPLIRKEDRWHDSYRSVCLVPESSSLKTIDDLQRVTQAGFVEWLFVHPFSVSGNLAAQHALRTAGIHVDNESARHTYSHSQSIRLLREEAGDRQRVAFVWDDAAGIDRSLGEGVRALEFPALAELDIPHDVIVARPRFPRAAHLKQQLLAFQGHPRYRFGELKNWAARYGSVRGWLEGAGLSASVPETEPVSLDEIGHLLQQYSRSQRQPPRLALVLSGGGAKCSYQVGVVAAIEQKLAALRRADPGRPLDIGLVVGTSGGAINSLPVALGITRTEAGQELFRETWLELDQRQIVRPSWLVRLNMGVWFAVLQSTAVIVLVRWLVPRRARRGKVFMIVFTVLAGAEILLGSLPGFSFAYLGSNHWLHHAWLWFSFGVREAAWSLFLIGLAAMLLEAVKARRGRYLNVPEGFTKTTIILGLVGLPLLQLITILGFEETLSKGTGMRDAVASKLPDLLERHLETNELPKLEFDATARADERLLQVSGQIVQRRLMTRDLVLTGSCLLQSSGELPSDLYFYLPASTNSGLPAFGTRGVSLADHPQQLLDVVLGSGSIFPVFPPREIEHLPKRGELIELVDGGFAHNSPVEAAVLWGATHIILVEATPRRRGERGNFLTNAASSFRHLHRQAQLLDARSRGKVVLFTLAPEPPHLCVLDFADNLIAASIMRGYEDAERPRSTERQFQRTLGEPMFVAVVP